MSPNDEVMIIDCFLPVDLSFTQRIYKLAGMSSLALRRLTGVVEGDLNMWDAWEEYRRS
jgi:hypothetical protein